MIFCFLFLASMLHQNSNVNEGKVDLFLNKVEKLQHRLFPHEGTSYMPNIGSELGALKDNMPMATPYFVDEETQLIYSLVRGKIYDPKLSIGLDIRKGLVYDMQNEKKYHIDSLKQKGFKLRL